MMGNHEYAVGVEWTGNRGSGTSGYREYGRQVLLYGTDKPPLEGSADPTFHGDVDRWNPEELLVAALAQCHLLSYLHSAVRAGVVVTDYVDRATGAMRQRGEGGSFVEVVLHPEVTVADASMVDAALTAHAEASRNCFIAASVNFPVRHEPVIRVAG